MYRKLILLAAAFSWLAMPAAEAAAVPKALGGSEAFIALIDKGTDVWRRDGVVREMIEKRIGFDRVDLNLDTTPAEISTKLQAFLDRPAAPGARRFVWISGVAAGNEGRCPADDQAPVTPRAATLILAPACYADLIDFPIGTRQIGLRGGRFDLRAMKRHDGGAGAPVVFLGLPDDGAGFAARADEIIQKALTAAAGGSLTPAALLQRLRFGFREDGSDYTPRLDAAPGSAAWSRRFLTPPKRLRKDNWERVRPDSFGGRLAWPRKRRLALYAGAMRAEPPVLSLPGRRPVTVLRTNRDGTMGFVRAPGALFGWVRLDALD